VQRDSERNVSKNIKEGKELGKTTTKDNSKGGKLSKWVVHSYTSLERSKVHISKQGNYEQGEGHRRGGASWRDLIKKISKTSRGPHI